MGVRALWCLLKYSWREAEFERMPHTAGAVLNAEGGIKTNVGTSQ
jgi:hypothetical protein